MYHYEQEAVGAHGQSQESVLQTHLLCSATAIAEAVGLNHSLLGNRHTHTALFSQNCWSRDVISFLQHQRFLQWSN